MKPEDDNRTNPGPGAVVQTAVKGLDAAPPAYAYDRAQSDMADAAHHHAPPHAPPARHTGQLDTTPNASVLVVQTPAPPPADAPIEGITTDPSRARRTERRRGAVIVLISALFVATVLVFALQRFMKPSAPTSTATATTTASTTPPAPPKTESTHVAPTATPSTAPTMTSTTNPKITPTVKSTNPPPTVSAPATAAPTDTSPAILTGHE